MWFQIHLIQGQHDYRQLVCPRKECLLWGDQLGLQLDFNWLVLQQTLPSPTVLDDCLLCLGVWLISLLPKRHTDHLELGIEITDAVRSEFSEARISESLHSLLPIKDFISRKNTIEQRHEVNYLVKQHRHQLHPGIRQDKRWRRRSFPAPPN